MGAWYDEDWTDAVSMIDDDMVEDHKIVSQLFFLMMDSNNALLPASTVSELCRETKTGAEPSPRPDLDDFGAEDLVDEMIESMKISLAQQEEVESKLLLREFAHVLTLADEDVETPLFRLIERRTTKPS